MKLKYFSILALFLLLICCAGTAFAADADLLASQDELITSMGEPTTVSEPTESAVASNEASDNPVSDANATDVPSTETTTTETATQSTASSSNTTAAPAKSSSTTQSIYTPVSSYSALKNALKNEKKYISLNADLKFSKPLDIRYNVVIDGQGHSIDGQKKSHIFHVFSATATLKNIYFKNAKYNKGGAISGYKAKVNLQKCTFASNKASDQGGAVYIYVGKLNINNCNFKYNTAVNGGGAIYVSAAPLSIKNSNFANNKVQNSKKKGHGGAIYICKVSSSISNTTFKSNTCISKALKSHGKATKFQLAGGAIYVNHGSKHTFTGCTFSGSKSSNHGGALYLYLPKTVTINKCDFKNNKVAYEDGGAITTSAKKLVIKNSNFYKNHAYEDGGVMDACSQNKKNIQVTFTGCTFKQNTAYKGGGVAWMGVRSYFTLKNNKFINNYAGMGGVLFAETTVAKITNCVFQGNQAKKVASWTVRAKGGQILKHCGGVLRLQNKNVQISGCKFIKNRATYGGVVFQSGGKLKMTANKFSGNTAKSGPKIKKG